MSQKSRNSNIFPVKQTWLFVALSLVCLDSATVWLFHIKPLFGFQFLQDCSGFLQIQSQLQDGPTTKILLSKQASSAKNYKILRCTVYKHHSMQIKTLRLWIACLRFALKTPLLCFL